MVHPALLFALGLIALASGCLWNGFLPARLHSKYVSCVEAPFEAPTRSPSPSLDVHVQVIRQRAGMPRHMTDTLEWTGCH